MPVRPLRILAALIPLILGAMTARAQLTTEIQIIARVDGEPVLRDDVVSLARELLPPEMLPRDADPLAILPDEIREQLFDRAITERALILEARRRGIQNNPLLRARLQRAEEQELVQALLAQEAMAQVTDDAITARVAQATPAAGGEPEVRARHILVRTEAEARAVLADLGRGGEFAALARRRSIDPGSANGGDLGFFKRGDMVREFAEAAFALQPGQTTPNPVRTNFGWHVIRVEERRDAPAAPAETSRDAIRQTLLREQADAAAQRIRAAARVERVSAPPPAR